MKVDCPSCHRSYSIPDERLPMGKRVSFPCANCKEKIKLDLRLRSTELAPMQEEDTTQTRPNSGKKTNGEELKEKILQRLDDLPPMPQVVLKAREVMTDENSCAKDVVKVIETDQSIAIRILKAANSAYYGMPGKISTIQLASVVLGYKTLEELITVAGSSKVLNKTLNGYGLGSGDLWLHSMSVGIGSRIIANRKNPELEGASFSAGLIHDAGKLVLDKYVMERKEDFEEIMEHGQETFMKAEAKIFGFNHADIGFHVCRHWRIPEDIATAIKYHHNPSHSDEDELAYIVYMADTIVNMADLLATTGGMGASIEAMMYMIDDKAMVFLGLQEADVKPIMDEITTSVGEMAGDMG